MNKPLKEIVFESAMKVFIAVLAAASIFAVSFFWAAASGQTDLIKEAESGFNLTALKLAVAAAALFAIIAFFSSFGKDPDGRRIHRVLSLLFEYIDDLGGLFSSAGGIAVLMAFNGKGTTFGWWGVGLLIAGFLTKCACAYGIQRTSP